MKFGLEIKDGIIKSRFGGIGESIAKSLNRNKDVYFLKNLKREISELKVSGQESIKVHSSDYEYLKIDRDLTTLCIYNEFEEEENPEIELGSIRTNDFLPLLLDFLELQIKEYSRTVQILDSMYAYLDAFIADRKEFVHTYIKRMNYANIYLNSGQERVDINYVLKIYKLEFAEKKIYVKKNRQYQERPPLIFELNEDGAKRLVLHLKEDLVNWYNEKMKMYYKENKLIVIPDED
ncbi:MAG: hypothetical protein AAFY76_08085 [Cyanobacteria bacterium J06649_11]